MGRPLREWFSGCTLHVINRGNDQQVLFHNEQDFGYFIGQMFLMEQKFNCHILAWTLMSNHYHIMIQSWDSISDIMQLLQLRYAKYFNKRYNRSGHVFQGRFYSSKPIQDDRYLLECSRYIHLNPVKACIVKTPLQYKYSSYKDYVEAKPFYENEGASSLPSSLESSHTNRSTSNSTSESSDAASSPGSTTTSKKPLWPRVHTRLILSLFKNSASVITRGTTMPSAEITSNDLPTPTSADSDQDSPIILAHKFTGDSATAYKQFVESKLQNHNDKLLSQIRKESHEKEENQEKQDTKNNNTALKAETTSPSHEHANKKNGEKISVLSGEKVNPTYKEKVRLQIDQTHKRPHTK